jgi:hypothetical protein
MGQSPQNVTSEGRVTQVEPTAAARSVSTLSRIDYSDAFLLETGSTVDRTGEQWARAVMESAPATTRDSLSRGWSLLGLTLGATRSDRHVLGWEVRRSTPALALLGADGRFGISGELLFEPRPDALLFATFVRLANPAARAVWAGVAPRHRRVVRHLLGRAARSGPS